MVCFSGVLIHGLFLIYLFISNFVRVVTFLLQSTKPNKYKDKRNLQMFQCEVVSIGGTYTDPLSIHTAMTILNLLRLFWSLYVLMGIPRSPFIVFPLLILIESLGFPPCLLWAHWSFPIWMPSIGIYCSLLSFIHYWSSSIHAACGRCDIISGILFQHWSSLPFMSSWGIHRSPSFVYLYWLLFWVFILGIFVPYSVLMFLPFPLFP